MRKYLTIVGLILFIAGSVLGFYASQRNCIIAFITMGRMNFWTAIEILGGLIALIGLITIILSLIKKT